MRTHFWTSSAVGRKVVSFVVYVSGAPSLLEPDVFRVVLPVTHTSPLLFLFSSSSTPVSPLPLSSVSRDITQLATNGVLYTNTGLGTLDTNERMYRFYTGSIGRSRRLEQDLIDPSGFPLVYI